MKQEEIEAKFRIVRQQIDEMRVQLEKQISDKNSEINERAAKKFSSLL